MTGNAPFALQASGLAKHYRRVKALDDCTVQIPAGRISALVGPNGAGKSTLMALACGLLMPSGGAISVLGDSPTARGMPEGVAYMAQEKPLYHNFTVDDMITAGVKMNANFDETYTRTLVSEAAVPLSAKIKTLSGGQRTRVALAIVLGRRPRLLIMDEPLADLDPLARKELMQVVLTYVAECEATVLMSSHVIADLEHVCDHLVLLAHGQVQLCGDVDSLLDEHRLMVGPRSDGLLSFPDTAIVDSSHTERESAILVRGKVPADTSEWDVNVPGLEELVLSYMRGNSETAVTA